MLLNCIGVYTNLRIKSCFPCYVLKLHLWIYLLKNKSYFLKLHLWIYLLLNKKSCLTCIVFNCICYYTKCYWSLIKHWANGEGPDQPLHVAASDPGLRILPISQRKDGSKRLIWVYEWLYSRKMSIMLKMLLPIQNICDYFITQSLHKNFIPLA